MKKNSLNTMHFVWLLLVMVLASMYPPRQNKPPKANDPALPAVATNQAVLIKNRADSNQNQAKVPAAKPGRPAAAKAYPAGTEKRPKRGSLVILMQRKPGAKN